MDRVRGVIICQLGGRKVEPQAIGSRAEIYQRLEMGLRDWPVGCREIIIETSDGQVSLKGLAGRVGYDAVYQKHLLICLGCALLATPTQIKTQTRIITQELSEIDRIRGAYCEVGSFEFGAPKPDMPETLCLLVTEGAPLGRKGKPGVPLPIDCRLVAELWVERAGGVDAPKGKLTEEVDGVAVEEWL